MNLRLLMTGLLMAILAAGFFLIMADIAPKSNDPKELMRVVGMTSGTVAGLGFSLILMGFFGIGNKKKR